MWTRYVWLAAITVLCLFFLSALPSCDVESPDRYVRPPIIRSFAPTSRILASSVGDSVQFSMAALDPDRQSLDYYFVLGDSVAGDEPQWTYVVEDTGDIDIDGRVTNGSAESTIRWHLRRVLPINLPPVIVSSSPASQEFTIIVGGTVEFVIGAEDPEGKPLSYAYTLDEQIVSASRRYVHHATTVGLFDVRAVVSDGETFVSRLWTLRVAAEPDYSPPAKVAVTAIGPGVESGEVDIEWTAVGDDGMDGLPNEYVLKTSPQPIADENAWTSSSDRFGEPLPAAPGTTMRMTVRELPPAQTVYIAVRAVDDFGNVSPLSDLASTKSRGLQVYGTVGNAVTGEPLEGITVKILSNSAPTAADGSFALLDLPAGTAFVRAEDDEFRSTLGDYFDVEIAPYEIDDEDVLDLWLLPNESLKSARYANFLDWYRQITDMEGTTIDLLDRWEIPCPLYVPQFSANGIDYTQEIKNAIADWESAAGMDLYTYVDAIPSSGVYVEFSDDEELDNYQVMVRDSRQLTILGRITIRSLYDQNTYAVFLKVLRHEVGHSLGLGHSIDPIHLMVGGRVPAVTQPSADEVDLVKAMYRLPRGFPAIWLLFD
jgi:hypothetical protein